MSLPARYSLARRILIRMRRVPKKFGPAIRTPVATAHETAKPKSLQRHGTVFIHTFPAAEVHAKKSTIKTILGTATMESAIELNILEMKGKNISAKARAAIGFEKNAVVVESIQGLKPKPEMNQLRRDLKTPWPNHLLHQIEAHARRCGFRYVKIRLPETLSYYKKPLQFSTVEIGGEVIEYYDNASPQQAEEIRKSMRLLYAQIAGANGYVSDGREFYVKRV